MYIGRALQVRSQTKAASKHYLGVVTAWTSTTVTVMVGERTLKVPRPSHYTSPAVNHVVLLVKSGRSFYCLGVYNTTYSGIAPLVPDPVPPSDGSGGAVTGTTPPPRPTTVFSSFRPLSTGTYRSGWLEETSNLSQGALTSGTTHGAAFYGRGASGLAGTGVSGTVRIKRIAGGDPAPVAPTLTLLAESTRPAGAPTVIESATGPALLIGDEATVELDGLWVLLLMVGAAGGIGISAAGTTPYVSLAGKAAWAPAMELTLEWSP